MKIRIGTFGHVLHCIALCSFDIHRYCVICTVFILTSPMPMRRIAHEAVFQSSNVKRYTPPLKHIGMPRMKHVPQVNAVTLNKKVSSRGFYKNSNKHLLVFISNILPELMP